MAGAGPTLPEGEVPAKELARLQRDIRFAEKKDRPAVLVGTLRQLRDLQMQYGAIDSALSTGLRVVQLYDISEDRLIMANDWRQLSRAAHRVGDLDGAIKAASRMVLILKTANDETAHANATLYLLDLLSEADRQVDFRHYSAEALKLFQEQGNLLGQTRVYYRQGENLLNGSSAADALTLLHLAMRNRGILDSKPEVARILFSVARAQARLKQWPKAREAFDQAWQLDPEAAGTNPGLFDLAADIRLGQNDLRAALDFQRLASHAKDSLFQAGRAFQAARIQVLYDIHLKDKDNAVLEAENQEAMAQLAALQEKVRWFVILCCLFAGAILFLLLWRANHHRVLRRARMKTKVVRGKVKEIEVERTELAQQNLELSMALQQAQAQVLDSSGLRSASDQTFLLQELLDAWTERFPDQQDSPLITLLRSRINVVTLVRRNLQQFDTLGIVNIKAHFTSLVELVRQECGRPHLLHVNLRIADDDLLREGLMPLSLLFAGLVRLSMEHSIATQRPGTVEVVLHRVGASHCELLYTDQGGAITGESLNKGDLTSSMVLTWARAMKGSIRLLKEEATTFQFTYEPQAAAQLRKAS